MTDGGEWDLRAVLIHNGPSAPALAFLETCQVPFFMVFMTSTLKIKIPLLKQTPTPKADLPKEMTSIAFPIPFLDMMAGLRYDHMFYNDRFHLGLQVGWEHHIYFSQNQFPVFVDDVSKGSFVSNQGDLTFQGWTFAARFDF